MLSGELCSDYCEYLGENGLSSYRIVHMGHVYEKMICVSYIMVSVNTILDTNPLLFFDKCTYSFPTLYCIMHWYILIILWLLNQFAMVRFIIDLICGLVFLFHCHNAEAALNRSVALVLNSASIYFENQTTNHSLSMLSGHVRTVSANKRSRYICDILFHWVRTVLTWPGSVNRKRTVDVGCYYIWSNWLWINT